MNLTFTPSAWDDYQWFQAPRERIRTARETGRADARAEMPHRTGRRDKSG